MGIKNPPRHDPQSSVGWLLQSNIRFSVGPDLQDCVVRCEIFVSIHILHLQKRFPLVFLSAVFPLLCTIAHNTSSLPSPKKGRLPLSVCSPRLVRGFRPNPVFWCAAGHMPIVRYSSYAVVRLWRCLHEPALSCCHPTPCGAI